LAIVKRPIGCIHQCGPQKLEGIPWGGRTVPDVEYQTPSGKFDRVGVAGAGDLDGNSSIRLFLDRRDPGLRNQVEHGGKPVPGYPLDAQTIAGFRRDQGPCATVRIDEHQARELGVIPGSNLDPVASNLPLRRGG
jgi:hypothetical protein